MPDLDITTIATGALSGLASASLLLWIVKLWLSERLKRSIEHEYSRLLADHKNQLDTDTAIAIENLKSRLQIVAAERQIRYANLYERQAETVSEIYVRVQTLLDAAANYVKVFEFATDPPKAERRLAVSDAMKEFTDFYRPNRIFLPKSTCDAAQSFYDKLFSLTHEFMVGVEQEGDQRYPDRDTWSKVDKAMRAEAKPLLESLEEDFRRLLGVLDAHNDE